MAGRRRLGWVRAGALVAAGAILGSVGLAAAQGYLGASHLTVNGTRYGGAFTPLEGQSGLYVPVGQLAAAMGFRYAWDGSTLAVTTGEGDALSVTTASSAAPATASSSSAAPALTPTPYPLALVLTTPQGTLVGLTAPDDLAGAPGGILPTLIGNGDPYAAVRLALRYRGKAHPVASQSVSLTVTGTVQGFAVIDMGPDVASTAPMAPSTPGVYLLAPGDFNGDGGPEQVDIFSPDAGTLTVTATDLSNPQVAPVSATFTFGG